MRALLQIPDLVLRKCIKTLNDSNLCAKREIVSLKKEDMVKVFAYQIESVPEEKQKEIPDYVVELYNYIFEDEAKKKIVQSYKYMPKMSPFGSREGTQAYIIDEMFLKGGVTIEDIAMTCNTTKRRIKNHMTHVRTKFNKKFVRNTDGRYYIKDIINDKTEKAGKAPQGFLD